MRVLDATANFAGALNDRPPWRQPLPSDSNLRIVSQHEAIRRRFDRQPVNPDVAPDQAVLDAIGQVADDAALEHDAVLDLRFANLGILHDRRERPDVGMYDPGVRANDDRASDDGAFDDGARFDDDFALHPRLGVDSAVDPPLDRVQDQPVRLEHVFELARVLPPSVDDVRPDLEPTIDQILNRIRDLELVAETGGDPFDRVE